MNNYRIAYRARDYRAEEYSEDKKMQGAFKDGFDAAHENGETHD
jgi:hypothetical protein